MCQIIRKLKNPHQFELKVQLEVKAMSGNNLKIRKCNR